MTDVPLSKPAARAATRQALIALTDLQRANASLSICQHIASSDLYSRASSLFLYYPVPPEVDLLPLARRALQDNKQIAFPRIDWDNNSMSPVAVTTLSAASFETRRHNIPEPPPLPAAENPPTIDLILVPALALDRAGNRLGRGGGFYDRFLALNPAPPTIAVCFDAQLLPPHAALPAEPHDIPVRTVVTESGLLSINPL